MRRKMEGFDHGWTIGQLSKHSTRGIGIGPVDFGTVVRFRLDHVRHSVSKVPLTLPAQDLFRLGRVAAEADGHFRRRQ